MSESSTLSSVLTGRERTAAPMKFLSLVEGVSMIAGTSIDAGILSIAYVSSKAGLLPLLFWLVLVGSLAMVTMPYVAEFTLRTRKHLQPSDLPKRYVGGLGALTMFPPVCVNNVGALTAYMIGSGKLLYSLFGISPAPGSVLFLVPTTGVLYLGPGTTGRGGKFIGIDMVMMISMLVIATLLKGTTRMGYLLDGNWLYMAPVFNVVTFCFSAQYTVPEVARGSADKPEELPRAIIVGMALTFTLLALVPLSVISFNGLDNISDVATISWGRAPGEWASLSADLFTLCAMLTSYWGLGDSLLTNIFDQFRLGNDEQPARRLTMLLVVVILPLALAYSGMVSFVNAPYFAGMFSGVILSITPILILKDTRQRGDLTLGRTCPAWMTYPPIQYFIVLLYLCGAVYAIAFAVGYLPTDW